MRTYLIASILWRYTTIPHIIFLRKVTQADINRVTDANAANACLLWEAIKVGCKPKGSGTLNNLYCQLLTIKLQDCVTVAKYAGKFKELYNDIVNMYARVGFNKNLLIFLFYTSLGKQYKDYFLTYT